MTPGKPDHGALLITESKAEKKLDKGLVSASYGVVPLISDTD